MSMLKLVIHFILLTLTSAQSSSPIYGAYISVQITQQILTAPPLPSLDGGQASLSPIAGFVTAKPVESIAGPSGSEAAVTEGNFQGYFAGLGYSSRSKGDLTYFVFGLGSSISGEMIGKDSGSFNAKDVQATGLSAVGGVSYRLLGDKTSMTGLGVFGGPGVLSIDSSLKIAPASGGSPTSFATQPFIYGAYAGAQFKLRLGKILVNPYVVSFTTLNETCQAATNNGEGSVSATSLKCKNGKEGLDLPSGLFGIRIVCRLRRVSV